MLPRGSAEMLLSDSTKGRLHENSNLVHKSVCEALHDTENIWLGETV